MNAQTTIPTILVNGFFGYGPDSVLCKTPMRHQWGGFAVGDLAKVMQSQGMDVREAKVSPLSSNWDRACELYAYIKGGRVDYGAIHSRSYGHERYGRFYPGIYPEWDNDHPINLWGHSMGAPTVRILTSLLYWGSYQEKENSLDDCPLLFSGHGKHMIHSTVTIAGVNNGTTLADLAEKAVGRKNLSFLFAGIGLAATQKPIPKAFDPSFDQWHFRNKKRGEDGKVYLHKMRESRIWSTTDLGFFDLTTLGARKINRKYPDNPNVYYFAYSTRATHKDKRSNKETANSDALLSGLTATIMGHYKDKDVPGGWKDEYYANDGMVNTEFSKAPFTEGSHSIESWTEDTRPKKGTWYNLPTLPGEHLAVLGYYLPFNKKLNVLKTFTELYEMIDRLE